MPDSMQTYFIDTAIRAVEKHSLEKDIAAFIKKEADRKYG